jgi:hypothetical protein
MCRNFASTLKQNHIASVRFCAGVGSDRISCSLIVTAVVVGSVVGEESFVQEKGNFQACSIISDTKNE